MEIKMLITLVGLFAAVSSSSLGADSYSLLDNRAENVVAPTYPNTSSVSGGQVGQIIYDASIDAFKGLLSSGSWISFSPVTNNYFSGYFGVGEQWSTTSSSFGDGTNSGGNTLTTRASNGLSVSAAASNVCGITWTPSSASAVYKVSANLATLISNTTTNCGLKLTDGTNVVMVTNTQVKSANDPKNVVLSGIYAPGTASAVTLKLQFAVAAGTCSTLDWGSGIENVSWSIVQIN